MNSFYTNIELKELGIKKIGSNVLISRKCSIYGAKDIVIGDNVRIDDFAILSGNIIMGNYIHIAAYTALYGGKVGIEIGDFSTISSRGVVYAVSDDYSGETMTNPMVSSKYRGVIEKNVIIGRHTIIGTGTTILPGVVIEEGVSVGAMSLVKDNLMEWGIYAGIPCRRIKERKKDILIYEKMFLQEEDLK